MKRSLLIRELVHGSPTRVVSMIISNCVTFREIGTLLPVLPALFDLALPYSVKPNLLTPLSRKSNPGGSLLFRF